MALKKVQEDIKRQADRKRKKTEEWKKGDRVTLSSIKIVSLVDFRHKS